MPPVLAACLCTLGVVYLLVRDVRQNPGLSFALWIPLTWYLIIASRLPSEWLGGGAIVMSSGGGYVDGSPLDRNIFLILIVLGTAVVAKRSVSWSRIAADNVAITMFLLFSLASVLWSDFPFVAFKRWYKVFGHVVMVLIVLTDREPNRAMSAMLRRCAYVLIPLSVLYIKYFPELGRGFDYWTGAAVNQGITTNKNALGTLCLLAGLYFVAVICEPRSRRTLSTFDTSIVVVFLCAIAWLLSMGQSSTATVSTVIGILAIVSFRFKPLRRHFSVLAVSFGLVVSLLLLLTNIKDVFIEQLGEDATLTGRTELWEDLQRVPINPVVGTGFESFWLGERLAPLWKKYWWQPNQAHNGYFEMYLNLGFVGFLLLVAMILSCYRKARRDALVDPPSDDHSLVIAEFRVAFVLALCAFNFTDATFKAMHPLYFMFFLASIDCGSTKVLAAAKSRQLGMSAARRRSPFLRTLPVRQAVSQPTGRRS